MKRLFIKTTVFHRCRDGHTGKATRLYLRVAFVALLLCQIISAKTVKIQPEIPMRPVPVRNVEYSYDGKLIAVPNLITAGSAGVFSVSQESNIAKLPARFSEKNFYRIAGVFYFASRVREEPPLVYLPLPELLSGYSVTFSPKSGELAIAGGDKVFMYSSTDWKLIRTITVAANTTRVIFSPDGDRMAVIADGMVYIFDTGAFVVRATIQPETNHKFADIAFSRDNNFIAALEYRNVVLDHSIRVRLFASTNGDIDRQLPYFPDKLTSPPGNHFPLISFTPEDSALVVSFEKSFGAKTVMMRSNDGTPLKEFKGAHHAFSPDMSMFASGGLIYTVADWKVIGKYDKGTLCCAFSPTDRTLLTISQDKLQRVKIELE